jgi:uncharacterized protein involved in cysteine biosynthesis
MASRFSNSPVITRLRNSPVISAAKRWASGKASPKPQPRDPNPRRYSTPNAFNTTTQSNQSFNQTATVPGNVPTNKISKFARNASPRARKMWEGFQEAAKGSWEVMQNPKVQRDYMNFVKSMGTILLAMYAVLGLLLFVYMPVTVFVLTLAPGFVGQILAMIPLWAFNIARKRTPMATNQLFLDELERLSPQRSKELEQQMKTDEVINKQWTEELYHDLRTSWHFTRYSLMWLSFSIIPIVGSFITWIGQTWLVADKMGWNLLSVYTISSKKMSYRQQKHWMRARKWRIIGFTLPFVLLASIPLVGPLVLGIAQAATAHIYFHLLSKDTETAEKKSTASPLIEFKKPT